MRGDVIEVYPTYEDYAIRIEMFGDEIDSIAQIDPVTGRRLKKHERMPDLSEIPLRPAARSASEGHRQHQGRAGGMAHRAGEGGQAPRGSARARSVPCSTSK